jgi:hypothetical protein
MHGTELRVQERQTFRLSAPLKPFSPAPGSMLQDSPQPSIFSPQRSRSLVTAFPSPTTAAASQRPPFQGQRSWPATSLPCPKASLPVRPFCSITFAGSPRSLATSMRSGPLQFCFKTRLAAPPASTPLWDSYIPSDQSVQQAPLPVNSPSVYARFPLAPRRRFYF